MLLAIFLVRLRGSDAFDAGSFGVAVIVLTTAALGAAVVLVARQPLTVEPVDSDETVADQGIPDDDGSAESSSGGSA